MIEYRMMDENCLLASCLHNGPIPLSASSETAWAEHKYGLPEGSIAGFLRTLCQTYGSCGVMAIDKGLAVAKIRFCPQSLMDTLSEAFLCVQAEDGARHIASFDGKILTPKDALPSKDLFVLCFQTHSSYRDQGIATEMLKALIKWAKANNWEHIRARAIQHIQPLLYWTGLWSIERYQQLGFQVTDSTFNEELRQGVTAMRNGDHSEEVRSQWAQYEHLSDDEASHLYTVVLNLA